MGGSRSHAASRREIKVDSMGHIGEFYTSTCDNYFYNYTLVRGLASECGE